MNESNPTPEEKSSSNKYMEILPPVPIVLCHTRTIYCVSQDTIYILCSWDRTDCFAYHIPSKKYIKLGKHPYVAYRTVCGPYSGSYQRYTFSGGAPPFLMACTVQCGPYTIYPHTHITGRHARRTFNLPIRPHMCKYIKYGHARFK